MKRHLAWMAAAVTVASSSVAFATPLPGLVSNKVGNGDTAVTACDSAFTVTYTTSGGKVTKVAIGGIADPACEGGQLKVTLLAGATTLTSGGPVTVPTDADGTDNSVDVPFSMQPNAPQVTHIAVAIAGP